MPAACRSSCRAKQHRIVVNCGLPATSREKLAAGRARHRRAFDRRLQRHVIVPLHRGRPRQAHAAGRRSSAGRAMSRSRARSAAARWCCAPRTTAMPTASASCISARSCWPPTAAGSTARTCSTPARRANGAASRRDQFAVRFHLHPSIKANRLTDGHGAMLMLPNKEVWTFNAYEDRVELEESVYLAGTDGPRRTMQIVIYGRARKVMRVQWTFAMIARFAASGAARPRRGTEPRRVTRRHRLPLARLTTNSTGTVDGWNRPPAEYRTLPCLRSMTESPPRIARLISVSDKTGLVEFARALPSAASSSSRPAAPQGARRRRAAGARRVRAHRLSRDDGRPRQDAAPEGARRPARDPRQPGARGRHAARTASAPIDLLVVNLYPFEATVAKGADFDDLHREHRHRRPGHDPRRRQEPRRRGGRRRPRRTTRACSPSSRRTTARPPLGAAQARSPPRPMRAPPPTTPRSRTGSRGARRRRRRSAPRRQARRAAALRREPAPAGGVLSHAGEQRPGVATARQLQGKQLSYNNINDTDAAYELRRRVRSRAHRRLRDHQARQPLRRRRRREHPRGLPQGAALRSGLGLRRHRRAQPHARRRGRARDHRDLHRGHHRAGRDRRGDRHRRRQEEPAPAARRRPARSARAGLDVQVAGRRLPGAVARQRRGRRHGPEGRHQARADQGRAAPTCASPSGSPST